MNITGSVFATSTESLHINWVPIIRHDVLLSGTNGKMAANRPVSPGQMR